MYYFFLIHFHPRSFVQTSDKYVEAFAFACACACVRACVCVCVCVCVFICLIVEDLSGLILHFWVAFWKLAQFFIRPYYIDSGPEPKNSKSPGCAPGDLQACPRHVPGVSREYPVETSDFWAPGKNRFSIVWQRSVPIFRTLLKSEVTPCIFPLRSPTNILSIFLTTSRMYSLCNSSCKDAVKTASLRLTLCVSVSIWFYCLWCILYILVNEYDN